MKTKAFFLMLFFSLFVLTLNAQASVIDFETLAHNDGEYQDHGATYTEGGFLLTNTATEVDSGFSPSLATYGSESSYFSGSTALINDNWEGQTNLTRTDGGLFNLNSISLSELYDSEPIEVVFTGVVNDGSIITQTLTLDGIFVTSEVFSFNDFSNLVSVSWLQTPDYHQFDNIDVAPVPEPTTMLLFGTGLAGIAGVQFRRKKK
jgi:hypothetical protein